MGKLIANDYLKSSVKGGTKLKSYYCPHCKKLVMKGNVKKLSMVCSHCGKMIKAYADELEKNEDV